MVIRFKGDDVVEVVESLKQRLRSLESPSDYGHRHALGEGIGQSLQFILDGIETLVLPTESQRAFSLLVDFFEADARAMEGCGGAHSSGGVCVLKMCGRPLDKLQRVPIPVLEHLSTQIGGAPPEIATLRAIYGKRRQTLFDHQQFALDTLGMTRFEITADAPRVLDALCDEVRAGVDGDKLLAQVRVILYERRYVIPAPRTVGELAKRARQTVEHEVSVAIERAIPPATRERWLDQLFEVRADGATLLEFLQEPAGSLRTKDITRESEKVSALLAMKIAEMSDLPGTERYWQMCWSRRSTRIVGSYSTVSARTSKATSMFGNSRRCRNWPTRCSQ